MRLRPVVTTASPVAKQPPEAALPLDTATSAVDGHERSHTLYLHSQQLFEYPLTAAMSLKCAFALAAVAQ